MKIRTEAQKKWKLELTSSRERTFLRYQVCTAFAWWRAAAERCCLF